MYIKHIWYWKDFMKINAWSVTKPRDCFWITDSFLAHINICSVRNQSNHTSDKVKPYFLHLGTVKGLNFHQWIRLRQPGGIKIFPINCLYLLSRNKRPFDVSWSINDICFEWHIYQLFTDKLICTLYFPKLITESKFKVKLIYYCFNYCKLITLTHK